MANLDMALDAVVRATKDALRNTAYANKVFQGWPLPEQLTDDLAKKVVVVSVYNAASGGRRTTKHISNFAEVQAPIVNLSAAMLAPVFQFGTPSTKAYGAFELSGSVAAGTLLLLEIAGLYVSYHPDPGYTLDVIAQGLVDAVNNHPEASLVVKATRVGPRVLVTAVEDGDALNGRRFLLHIGGTALLARSTRQQTAQVQVHVWAWDNATRAAVSNTIDDAFDDINFLVLPDGTHARLTYDRTVQTDLEIKHGVFRRILHYTVEYVSTQVVEAPQVLAALVTFTQDQ